jgi:hypothetical protein
MTGPGRAEPRRGCSRTVGRDGSRANRLERGFIVAAIVVAWVIRPTRIEVRRSLLRGTRARRARGWRRTGPPRPPRRRQSRDKCCWRRGRVGLSGDRTRELISALGDAIHGNEPGRISPRSHSRCDAYEAGGKWSGRLDSNQPPPAPGVRGVPEVRGGKGCKRCRGSG